MKADGLAEKWELQALDKVWAGAPRSGWEQDHDIDSGPEAAQNDAPGGDRRLAR